MDILEEIGNAIRSEGVSLVDLLVAGALIGFAIPAARLVEGLVRLVAVRIRKMSDHTVDLLGNGSRYLTLFALVATALNLVGVNVGLVVVVAVLLLILVVLTLRPLVENAAAGFLLWSRPSFAVGDEVRLSGYIGTVLSIGARTTVLRTRDGLRVHVPNTDVLEQAIVVYTAFETRRLSVDMSLDPRCNLDSVADLLIDALGALPEVRGDPAPAVTAATMRDGVLQVAADFWFEPNVHSERHVMDAAVRSVHDALRRAGIDPAPPRLDIG